MDTYAKSFAWYCGGFKSSVTKRIKEICEDSNIIVWQRNYYDSIVRNEQHLNQIRQDIIDNPLKWNEDPERPENQSQELLIDFVL